MVTSLLRWTSLILALSCALAPWLRAQSPACATISAVAGPSPSVTYEANALRIRVQGQFRQDGDLAAYTVTPADGATVFSREISADSEYSVTPLTNAVKVCILPVPATATGAPAGNKGVPAPQTSTTAAAVLPTAAPSASSSVGSQGASATAKPNCINDPVSCDIGATLESMAAPESPAFTVLGLSPKNVTRPTSPTDFATALLSGFDQNGNLQSGIALDAAPVLILGRSATFWSHYSDPRKKYWWVRPLARTTFSYGTAKGASSSDPALRLATGLRVVLYDERDPRYLYGTCIRGFEPNLNAPDIEAEKHRLQVERQKCIAQKESRIKEIWNATSLAIAGSPVWISPDGSTPNLRLSGGGYWTSAAVRLQTWGQIIGHFRRLTGEQVPAPHTPVNPVTGLPTFFTQGTTLIGGSFRFGSGKFNGNVDGLYVHKNVSGRLDSYPELDLGLERKLAESFYLDATYRYAVGTQLTASGFVANLKWSFSKVPTMLPQGGGN